MTASQKTKAVNSLSPSLSLHHSFSLPVPHSPSSSLSLELSFPFTPTHNSAGHSLCTELHGRGGTRRWTFRGTVPFFLWAPGEARLRASEQSILWEELGYVNSPTHMAQGLSAQ
uniref:Uncharacterized protein n=1 Tax=Anguilla anguilla TaxID=7936 RepID=A0A0E9RXM8_ANGAN